MPNYTIRPYYPTQEEWEAYQRDLAEHGVMTLEEIQDMLADRAHDEAAAAECETLPATVGETDLF